MFATLCNLNCLWIFSLNIAFGEHDLFLGYLRIFVQVPGFRLDISPDFQYKNGYPVSKRISGIKRISSIKTDIRYQNGYLVSKRISGIKTDIKYLFWVQGRISVKFISSPFLLFYKEVVSYRGWPCLWSRRTPRSRRLRGPHSPRGSTGTETGSGPAANNSYNEDKDKMSQWKSYC